MPNNAKPLSTNRAPYLLSPVPGQEIAPGVKVLEHDSKVFGPDPNYEDKPYDAEKQLEIYGPEV